MSPFKIAFYRRFAWANFVGSAVMTGYAILRGFWWTIPILVLLGLMSGVLIQRLPR